ncbi:MAG: tetratricopeptide repeat protein [Leadbetterella sp.]
MWIKKTIILVLLAAVAYAQDINLADGYFKQGEYDKAAELYKKIATDKDQARVVHSNYLQALYKINSLDQIEKFVRSQIKYNPENYTYKGDYAQFLESSGKSTEAAAEFQRLIQKAAPNDNNVYELQNFFYTTNRIELAIDLLLESRRKSNDIHKHDYSLARAYLYLDKKDKMLTEMFSFGLNSNNQQIVQQTIQDNISTEEEIAMLEKFLFDKIQEDPNDVFHTEILAWHLAQKQDFGRAFIQQRALDRRLKLEGSKVFELAGQAYTLRDFKNAAKMYQYVLDEYPEGDLYPYARRWIVQSKEELVKNTFPVDKAQIVDLIKQYDIIIEELQQGFKIKEALRNKGLLEAFYLGEYSLSIESLNKAIIAAQNDQKFKDQCKLDLGDIYILKEEPWESTLLYMQVEKSQKEDGLGELAKLKNAKLHYYTGEFKLSKEILDILKKATTREISNDALQLSLLIQDNTGLDSSEAAMREFSSVDMLLFKNKFNESIDTLSRLFDKYRQHSLADEILWLRANTYLKINKIEEAMKDMNSILENYRYDILADDALFHLANLTIQYKKDKSSAMALYRKLLSEYPGSIYAAQSRIKFRELRGDIVN